MRNILILIILLTTSCAKKSETPLLSKASSASNEQPWAYEGIKELKRGDILVRPNLNIFPGTSFVSMGWGFGHAALVIEDYQHDNIDSLLAGTQTIESIAKNVSTNFQIREISGLVRNQFDAFNNDNFDDRFIGNRYRLRLPMRESQIDSIIIFAKAQKGDHSAWNATKSFSGNAFNDSLVAIGERENWADNDSWYCSQLVWQSLFYITGKDTDINGGYMVYPNDLINSGLFDNTTDHQGRARF